MQTLLMSLLVVWALWVALGFLFPKFRRQLQGRLARWSEGRLPRKITEILRPRFPKTGCGCGTQCHEPPSKSN